MGNSGSAHHLATIPNSDEQIKYRHSPSQWSQSIPRDSTNRHSHQIKVLPELKGACRLRPTNNGNILHGGGTLSGRRDLALHNGVFRTRSTSSTRSPDPSESVHAPHPNRLMQRSRTQLAITRGQPERKQSLENAPMKRFGSEPDLRSSGDERNNSRKEDTRTEIDGNNFPKAKLIRNKKKKAAPLPPIQLKVNEAMADKPKLNYDPSRFGWKKEEKRSFEKVPAMNKENLVEKEPPKKLRLFKTKAEMRKVNDVAVVQNENEKRISTDQRHSHRYSISEIERQPFNSLPYYHDPRNQELDRLSDHHDERETNTAHMPQLTQRFRREKSFDLSLLMQQKEAKSTTPVTKPVHSKIFKDIVDSQRTGQVGRISGVESKLRSRKLSQPVTPAINSRISSGNDFKKELLAATRRRSQNIELKTSADVRVTEPKSSINQNEEEFQSSSRNKLIERAEERDADVDLQENDIMSSRNLQIGDSDVAKQHPQLTESATKTFYFGMSKDQSLQLNDDLPIKDKFNCGLLTGPNQFLDSDSESTDSSLSSALVDHFPLHMIHSLDEHLNDPDSNPNGIQVNVRPTLPRRQFEVPRFSPAAAWRHLAQTDCDIAASPDETKNVCEQQNYTSYGANDTVDTLNQQQLLESRIERVYRDPVPGFPDNKSGDSGISGDAGLQERVESPTVREGCNNDKIGPFLLPWTPLQDLGEESSSDDGDVVNSREELTKLMNRGHVFSLSLPRESHLLGYGGDNLQLADAKTFNSLQKLKRTVSSAFGGSNDSRDRNKTSSYHNDNWMLSRSAPNSIDNNLFSPILNVQSDCGDDNDDAIAYDEEDNNMGVEEKYPSNEYRSYNRRPRQQTQNEHSKILPPSFNYLTGGKHLMYLPNQDQASGYEVRVHTSDVTGDDRRYTVESNEQGRSLKERESLQDPPEFTLNGNQQISATEQAPYSFQVKTGSSTKSRNHHRFTFQSTVRQIERRRLAERLSKDAEQKEAQRLSELEAMRRVEEEFQKKRAREKASIRHQLRLYSLGEDYEKVAGVGVSYSAGQYTSLPHIPIEWKSNGPRDEPDGCDGPVLAPSPTSQKYLSPKKSVEPDIYVDTKTPYISRLIEQKSGKFHRNSNSMKNIEVRTPPTEVLSEFHTTRREYIEYRNSRKFPVNNSGLSAHSLGHQHQQMTYKPPADDEPSDNYRKSFAHGRSICSSDSDMSGPIVRSVGRHKHRSRSPSPL